jgi:hypothetical protein
MVATTIKGLMLRRDLLGLAATLPITTVGITLPALAKPETCKHLFVAAWIDASEAPPPYQWPEPYCIYCELRPK